jgi:hypothetical protein
MQVLTYASYFLEFPGVGLSKKRTRPTSRAAAKPIRMWTARVVPQCLTDVASVESPLDARAFCGRELERRNLGSVARIGSFCLQQSSRRYSTADWSWRSVIRSKDDIQRCCADGPLVPLFPRIFFSTSAEISRYLDSTSFESTRKIAHLGCQNYFNKDFRHHTFVAMLHKIDSREALKVE